MFENILEESKTLTTAVDFLNEKQAKKIIGFISETIMESLGAYTIDVMLKETNLTGDMLQPFYSKRDEKREKVTSYSISNGEAIWSVVCDHEKPVWIEDIQSKRKKADSPKNYIKLTKIENKLELDIQRSELVFYQDTDTIIVIPISYKNTFLGVYSIELNKYQKKIEDKIFEEISELVDTIATIIWKSDAHEQYIDDTEQAINGFIYNVKTHQITFKLSHKKEGFIIRPFKSEYFQHMEDYINEYLHKKGINIKHHSHDPGQPIVINSLMGQVKRAHFAIIDITENNLNCLLELGMIMILNKNFIILKRKDDNTKVPFDISAYQYYRYEKQGMKFVFFEPGNYKTLNISDIFDAFIKELKKSKIFNEAEDWEQK